MCGHRIGRFLAYRAGSRKLPALIRSLNLIGSDVDNFECPRCGSHDRERHLLLYLRASGLLEWMRGKSLLHFAPERHLSRVIAAQGPTRYVRCDLNPQSPDEMKVDIESMAFEDGSFDLLIANHVLEHVADDRQALFEISRVLAPGGYAILQTPYSSVLHRTWTDPGIVEESARLQAFGQEDHVRLFGQDIFERFSANGLLNRVASHQQLLKTLDATRFGVNPKEPFFLFQKSG